MKFVVHDVPENRSGVVGEQQSRFGKSLREAN